VKATTRSALYGAGVFTTVRIIGGEPWAWEKHWRRLSANAETIGIDISAYSEEVILDQLKESIQNDGIVNGRARITFFDESSSPIWSRETTVKTSLSILTGELRRVPEEFGLTISPFPVNTRSPLAGIKSCNYLENLLAVDEAKDRGFDEAVRLNENRHVTSACMANVFWISDGKLFTPSLETGCLAGTTREFVLENIQCEEIETGIDDLNDSDAIFLTSAGRGIVQVDQFNEKTFQKTDHPILKLLPSSA
jgi:branched-subunit amino acid aminotransferase/4-amino-4-deoxychorismate lyase